MAEYTGKNLSVTWAYLAGTATTTVDLSGDFRKLGYKPTIGKVKGTAGSDPFESYLMTVKDTVIDLTAVMQVAGTAVEDALTEGTFGTLIVGPEGTATGKRKYTIPSFSMGANFAYEFDKEVEIACQFQGSGTRTNGSF
jgi:hypothetical protein